MIKIHINKEETIQVSINNKEIKLNQNDNKSEYKLNIKFNSLYYDICLDKKENVITDIMKNITTNKIYEIEFQEKQYKLNSKQILVIIIDKFIQIIKKENIIEGNEFEIERENEEIIKIINNLYYELGYENVIINHRKMMIAKEKEEIRKEEIEEIDEIIENNNKYEQQKEIRKKLELKENKIYTEEELNKEIKKLTTEEREKLKMYKLNNNCMYYVSKYFDVIIIEYESNL